MSRPDLGPAADALSELVAGVSDDQLELSTPCQATSLGALLDHVDGLALAFTCAARKEPLPPGVDPTPRADAASLLPGWRSRIPTRLAELVEAWRDPAAWEGMATVGGVDLRAAACGATGLDELVVHAWDIARSHRTRPALVLIRRPVTNAGRKAPERSGMRSGEPPSGHECGAVSRRAGPKRLR